MNGRMAKHWRKEFKRRWRFDSDEFINDVIDLPFKWRFNLICRILMKIKYRVNAPKKATFWVRVKQEIKVWLGR